MSAFMYYQLPATLCLRAAEGRSSAHAVFAIYACMSLLAGFCLHVSKSFSTTIRPLFCPPESRGLRWQRARGDLPGPDGRRLRPLLRRRRWSGREPSVARCWAGWTMTLIKLSSSSMKLVLHLKISHRPLNLAGRSCPTLPFTRLAARDLLQAHFFEALQACSLLLHLATAAVALGLIPRPVLEKEPSAESEQYSVSSVPTTQPLQKPR